MKINKRGMIFDPSEHRLMVGCIGAFAQSPQVLALDDGVRVYFSTRSEDHGKFRSHISYVDFEDDMKTVRDVARHQVIPLGALGSFDEHGIFPLNVLPVGDEVWGYTTGWSRRISVSVETGIGYVVSSDGGRTFERRGEGPVLSASLHEPFLVGDGFVIRQGNQFIMWYIFGQTWVQESQESAPDRVYKIAVASSADGVNWQKNDGNAILPDAIDENECQALPSVAAFSGRFHMVFCYRNVHDFRDDPAKGYRLGYAVSEDLKTWTRDDAVLANVMGAPGEWDADMQCYPHVFVHQNELHLLYNGNAFGRCGFGHAVLSP